VSCRFEAVVDLDTSTILNLHHQVTIYAVDIAQQIENLLSETAGKQTVPRETMLKAIEQIAFLNRKVLAVTRFAAKAKFKLDSEKIETDLAGFITDYIDQIVRAAGSARLRIQVENTHPGLKARFNPIDASIIVDNLIRSSPSHGLGCTPPQENLDLIASPCTDARKPRLPVTHQARGGSARIYFRQIA
jgi:hypothetical protein